MASAWGGSWGGAWGASWGSVQIAAPVFRVGGGGGSVVGGGPDAQVRMSEFIRRFGTRSAHPVRYRRPRRPRKERDLVMLLLP